MALKTSLLTTGDASLARAEVASLASAVEKLGAGAKATAAPIGALDQAQRSAADSARDVADAAGQTSAELGKVAIEAVQAGSIMGALGAASDAAGAGAERAGSATAGYAAQLAALRAHLDPAGEAQRKLAAATDLLDTALARGDVTAEQYAVGLAQAGAAAGGVTRAQALLDAAMAQGTISAEQLAVGMKAAAGATSGHAGASMQMGAAGMIAEHVVRSFSDSIAAGQSPIRAATMEMGRVTEAMTLFAMQSGNAGGALGKFAGFMGGPWGIAMQIGVAVLTPLISRLFDTGDAADTAQKALADLGKYEDNLSNFIDKTTGALIRQNAALVERAKTLRQQTVDDSKKQLTDATVGAFALARSTNTIAPSANGLGSLSTDSRVQAKIAASGNDLAKLKAGIDALAASDPTFKKLSDGIGAFAAQAAFAGQNIAKSRGEIAELTVAQAGGVVSSAALVRQQVELVNAHGAVALARAKLAGVEKEGDAIDRMAYGPAKIAALDAYGKKLASAQQAVNAAEDANKKPKKLKSTPSLDKFGDSAATRIADIVGQYNPAPNLVALEKTNKAIRGLDEQIKELGTRQPDGFKKLIASAEQAKLVVREGIVAELANAFEKPKTLGEQAAAAFAKLDVIEKDAGSQKYQGFRDVIAFVEQKKGVIADALVRPYQDYVKAQRDDLAVMQLQALGLDDQATALKEIQTLEKNGVPLTQAQKDAVLDTVEAMRAEQRQIDINKAHTQLYVDALGGIKTVVEDATQSFMKGDLGQLIKTPGKLLDIFSQLQGKEVFEKLFGSAFQDLQDQVTGASPLKQASQLMASALDTIPPHVASAADALNSMAPPAKTATDALGTLASQAGAAARALGVIAQPNSSVAPAAPGATTPASSGASGDDASGDVVVTGSRVPKVSIDGDITRSLHSIAEIAGVKLPASTMNAQSLFESSIGKIATSITGLFTNDQTAEILGKKIGKFSGEAFSGAATGSMVAGIGNSIGLHLSTTGAEIGGGLEKGVASLLGTTLGPVGTILASLGGGLLGSLFGGGVKYGGGTVTSQGVQGSTGNNAADQTTGLAEAGTVLSTLNSVVSQLGGTGLGDFGQITVGKYGDKYRVNDHGTNLKSNNDVLQFDDEASAENFAVWAALSRGAVQGLTPAVQKALQSSKDVNAAVQEAMNVSALETFIGGIDAATKKTFDTEQTTANARVALAQKYGLDILATEKANAEERADLITSTLKTQVGSLQDLIDSMTSGDLFEGSASDRRTALQSQIAAAQVDAAAGKDGAADKVASLYQQLLTTSKDAYGTAGQEYQADRTSVSTGAQQLITAAQARITTAAGGTDGAATVAAVNAVQQQADETNDQLAKLNSQVSQLIAITQAGNVTTPTLDLSAVMRPGNLT